MKIRRIATQALTGLTAGILLIPGTAASANTYTVTWTWEVPHVTVASPTEFTIAVGDVTITDQDLDSDRLVGMVGVLAVTAEVSVTASPPVGHRTTCAAGDGVIFTLPDVAGSTYVEARFVREGTLEVLAGPHRTGTGSGEPITFEICGPVGAEPVADVLGGPPTDEPDPGPQPGPGDDPETVCGVPPRHESAEDRGSPCPPDRENRASDDRRTVE